MKNIRLVLLALAALLLVSPASGDGSSFANTYPSGVGAIQTQAQRHVFFFPVTCRTTTSTPAGCFATATHAGALNLFKITWTARDVTTGSAANSAEGEMFAGVQNVSGTNVQLGSTAFTSTQFILDGTGAPSPSFSTTLSGANFTLNVAINSTDTIDWQLIVEQIEN